MNKKFILGIAAAAVLTAGSVFGTSAAEFAKANTYTPGMFTDVSESEWYASSIASSYELGFMKGSSDTLFEPNGNMTVAEAITIAARVHDAYNAKGTQFGTGTTNWYDDYVSYAVTNGIIEEGQFDDYNRPVKRWEMAVIFSNSVPDSFLEAKNDVDEIPDVPNTNSYFDRLQLLYNAGVVMGNDEFGTFMPNNNIIRAEAAAIINRVALPESRLQKTLVDANYGDAYYLVNHGVNWGLGETSTHYDTPWNYDNRNRMGIISNSANNVTDYYPDGKVELWRDVDNVYEGLVGWDFSGNISMAENGVYFKLTDDELNEVAALTTKDGKFLFNGTDTGVEVPDGSLYFTINVDLDVNTAELYINGAKVGDTFTAGDYTVSRMYIGSSKEGTGNVSITRCDLYKDYLVNEIFLVPENSALSQWEVTGTGEVVTTGGQNYGDTRSAKMTAGSVAKQTFNPISGSVVYESYMLFPEDADTGYVSLNSGDTSVAKLVINNDGVFTADGTKLRFHNNNIWQTLRIEADTVNNTVTYKVNGKIVGDGALDAYAATVDNVTIGVTGGTAYFDDVKVFLTHEYDDYCPTPTPITDDGYDVILNICSLWREGTHFGWGAVTGYPDIEPALGYYDEGLTEVADWEIKFMVENGIDVQHLCWYCPSNSISEPIKKSNMNNALHDGFFNAEYSDMMKFTFMWENNGVNAQSLEQFETYIWDYWMDYYFLDPRFYTIDNKIVFTVWNYGNFKTAFGGTNEGCLEAIEFMNNDAKANGFDGVMIFFADGHAQDAGSFRNMAAIGGTASYAYHWNQDGIYADKTIARLQRNQDYGEIHIVPTVSVGFNNIGWSGVRKDLASLEDHREVLEYIKNDYLTKETGWKANTLIVSTWNEYGEGTYVMPCAGLHGFGYLENIAEVISGVTDHSNNIYPTEQQKARLGHLYPESKTSLVQLDYEEETQNEPQAVLYSVTGDDMTASQNYDTFSTENGIIKVSTSKTDPAIKINDDKMPTDMNTEDVIAIRVSIKSSVDTHAEIFFTTDQSPNLSQENSFNTTVKKSDDFVDYVFTTEGKAGWIGTISTLRFDIISTSGDFEVSKIEFLGYSEEQLPITITVDNKLYEPPFHPVAEGDEVYVVADAYKGFFSLHNFYYEWSRFTNKLYILTKNDHEIEFNIDSDIAIVDGEEVKLAKAVTLRDGLPVLPLFFLYDIAELTYTYEGKAIVVSSISEEYQEIIENRVAYQYEFEVPGDMEGFSPAFSTLVINNGTLSGMAIARPNETPLYDPMFTLKGLNINTLACNKILVGMKHKFADPETTESRIEVFFATTTETGLSQDKSTSAVISGNSTDEFVEYVLDFSENEKWTGTVTTIRVDPMSCGGSFDIDYIRFVMDEEMAKENEELIEQQKKEEEERLAKGIIIVNGDAEDTANATAFYGEANNATVEIYEDPDKGNVWKVTPAAGKVWAYIRQKTTFTPGMTYSVSVDIKLTGTLTKTEDVETEIYCNTIYTGADGKTDHNFLFTDKKISTNDGWQTYTFEFTIPEDTTFRDKDCFTFYANPIGDEGVGYMLDNIVIEKAN